MEKIDRYPGIKPFTEGEGNIFYGRNEDVSNLYNLIYTKQTTILYGKSGYGKSSVIKAGLVPKLESEAKWKYFLIRFSNYSEKCEENITPMKTVLNKLSEPETSHFPFEEDLADENSFWYKIKKIQYDSENINHYILIFDQFEELFSYPADQIEEFSNQLSQLLYTTIPLEIKKKLTEIELKNKDEGKIIDDNTNAFMYRKPDVKVLFSIRTDRLSLVNTLSNRHPAILQNYYELQPLNKTNAQRAITEPAFLPQELGFISPSFSYADEVLENILNHVSDGITGNIDTATIQMICKYVEHEIVIKNKKYHITNDLLGDISNIFQSYYENVLKTLNEKEKICAQNFIENQLIENGKRNIFPQNYIIKEFEVNINLLNKLEEYSLLRKEQDSLGRMLYEISHDSLIEPIEKLANIRRKEEAEIKLNLLIEQEILKSKELEQKLILEKKRSEELNKEKNKARRWNRVAVMGFIVCFFLGIISFAFWKKSNNEKEKTKQALTLLTAAYFENGDKILKIKKPSKGDYSKAQVYYATAQDKIKKVVENYKKDSLYIQLAKRIKEIDKKKEKLKKEKS